MEDENYKALLEENKKLLKRIDAMEKRVQDVVAFNKTLLSSSEPQHQEDKAKRAEALNARLKEALHVS